MPHTGGVGRYARTYVALSQYLRELGALPVSACQAARDHTASPAVLCDNCAHPVRPSGNDARYVRLGVADVC